MSYVRTLLTVCLSVGVSVTTDSVHRHDMSLSVDCLHVTSDVTASRPSPRSLMYKMSHKLQHFYLCTCRSYSRKEQVIRHRVL